MPLSQESGYRGDASLQELIFIGHLYCHPDKFDSYVGILDNLQIFASHPAKDIWEATQKYWREYGKIPDTEEIQRQVIDEKSWIPFAQAIEYNLSDQDDKIRFTCDEFVKTIKLTMLRNNQAAIDFQLNSGVPNLERALELQEKLTTDISSLDTAETSGGLLADTEILSKWAEGKLVTQQPLIPIGIPGMDPYIPGAPKQQLNIIAAPSGMGKAHPNSLEIPTPNGVRKWGELRPGDTLFGTNGETTRILNVYPQGVQDIYEVVFSDGTRVPCTLDHLWTVTPCAEFKNGGKLAPRTMSVRELLQHGTHTTGVRRAKKWKVGTICAVDYPKIDLPIHPYVLGCWLGNGSSRTGVIHMNSTRIGSLAHLKETSDMQRAVVYKEHSKGITCGIKGLCTALREIGLFACTSSTKYIPKQFLHAALEDRIELFAGLMDTDGECTKKGQLEYSTISKQLAEDICVLVQSLGGRAHIRPTIRKGRYKKDGVVHACSDSYRLSIAIANSNMYFYDEFKKGRCHELQKRYYTQYICDIRKKGYAEECMCVSVDSEDHLYLVNGYTPTHNSTALCQITNSMLQYENVLYATLEMPAPNILFKILASRAAEGAGVDPNLAFHTATESEYVSEEAMATIHAYLDDKSRKRLFILDMPAGSLSASGIAAAIKRIKRVYGVMIGAVMIDYADNMKTNQGRGISDDGFSYMIPVMNDCAAMCKELDVVGWTASQTAKGLSDLSRDAKTFRPVFSKDLWGSDAKMQVSNLELGLAIYRVPGHERWGIGALSKLKDRFAFGKGESVFVVTMDYKKAHLVVKRAAESNIVWSDEIAKFEQEVIGFEEAERIARQLAVGKKYVERTRSTRVLPAPKKPGREDLGDEGGF